MEKENTNGGSVYVTVDGHFKPVHVSMKGTGEKGFLEFMLEDVEKALKETEEGVSKCTPSVFYAQSPDFHKLGLCYYLKILYL